jgi:hypothetical protein
MAVAVVVVLASTTAKQRLRVALAAVVTAASKRGSRLRTVMRIRAAAAAEVMTPGLALAAREKL